MFNFGRPYKICDFVFWIIKIPEQGTKNTFLLQSDTMVPDLPYVSFYTKGSFRNKIISVNGETISDRTIVSPLTSITRPNQYMTEGQYETSSLEDNSVMYCIQLVKSKHTKRYKKREVHHLNVGESLDIDISEIAFVSGRVSYNQKTISSTDDGTLAVVYCKESGVKLIVESENALVLIVSAERV